MTARRGGAEVHRPPVSPRVRRQAQPHLRPRQIVTASGSSLQITSKSEVWKLRDVRDYKLVVVGILAGRIAVRQKAELRIAGARFDFRPSEQTLLQASLHGSELFLGARELPLFTFKASQLSLEGIIHDEDSTCQDPTSHRRGPWETFRFPLFSAFVFRPERSCSQNRAKCLLGLGRGRSPPLPMRETARFGVKLLPSALRLEPDTTSQTLLLTRVRWRFGDNPQAPPAGGSVGLK